MNAAATETRSPELGQGIYSFPQAARILARSGPGASERQLRYWITTGLTPATYWQDNGRLLLTFEDLVSLEIVRRFRRENASLQSVRTLEEQLREEHPTLERPFAHDVFYFDGATFWIKIGTQDERRLVEATGPRKRQYAWEDAIASFAQEIRWSDTGTALAWDLSPWVEIDPTIQFGSPVVKGTRTPAQTILANLEVGTPEQVASWYALSVEQVEGVRDSFAS